MAGYSVQSSIALFFTISQLCFRACLGLSSAIHISMNSIEQVFFNDLEKKLWTAANKLLPSLDAAVYKHIALGLLFIKYVSDAFEERQIELKTQFQDASHDYYMNPDDYAGTYEADLAAELEVRDYYTERNVFWVPVEARWQALVDCAQLSVHWTARQWLCA